MDIHHEPLHSLIGMRYRILGPPAEIQRAIDTGETHVHWPLQHEGVGFYPSALADTAQFSKQPGLIEYLTYSSIPQLAHTDIHELVALLRQCIADYALVVERNVVCGICAKHATQENPV